MRDFGETYKELRDLLAAAEARIAELKEALADLQEYICAGGATDAEHDAMMARVDRLLENTDGA